MRIQEKMIIQTPVSLAVLLANWPYNLEGFGSGRMCLIDYLPPITRFVLYFGTFFIAENIFIHRLRKLSFCI